MVHKCDVCLVYFKTTAERAEHKLERHKVRLTCKICDKYFRTVKTLDSHNSAHHSGRDKRKKFSRGDEDDACDDDAGVTKKRKIQDDKQQPFECGFCDKRFTSPEGLYRHKLFHGNSSAIYSILPSNTSIILCVRGIKCAGPDGSLVHKCHGCFGYFATTEERDAHMLAAHKDKLTCDICNKLFHRVRARQNHYSYHHGDRNKEKNFEWAKCGENSIIYGRAQFFRISIWARLQANHVAIKNFWTHNLSLIASRSLLIIVMMPKTAFPKQQVENIQREGNNILILFWKKTPSNWIILNQIERIENHSAVIMKMATLVILLMTVWAKSCLVSENTYWNMKRHLRARSAAGLTFQKAV